MAKIRAKLKQLRDADVRYISLVDRAATRIPFRVLKRDEKENKMGIDLTKVFKSDDTRKPYVSALVVFAQKDETAGKQVVEAIQKHGFKTDRVQKSDEGETLVFAQADKTDDVVIVRLSDQMLVNVGGLQTPGGWMGEFIKENGFFPDLVTASTALHNQIVKVMKSDTPQDDAAAILTSYAEYINEMVVLPANAFKLDAVIAEIVEKCSCEDEKAEDEEDDDEDEDDKEAVTKDETEAEKKKRIKDHPPAEMAPPDEDDDQKPPPTVESPAADDDTEEAKKRDKKSVKVVKTDAAILAALKSIETTVTGLSTKVETVITEQATQKKTLDEVVKKTDTLGTKLETTVTAPPVAEDRPAGDGTRMRTQKADDDPRTGNFDTAFLRRRR